MIKMSRIFRPVKWDIGGRSEKLSVISPSLVRHAAMGLQASHAFVNLIGGDDVDPLVA